MDQPAAPKFLAGLFFGLVMALFFLSVKTLHKSARTPANFFFDHFKDFLPLWIVFLSVLAILGFFKDFSALPPRLALVFIPMTALLLYLAWTKHAGSLLRSVSLRTLTYVQSFRIGMEIILYLLVEAKAMPESMTYTGKNFDILVGLSAPIMGYFAFTSDSFKPLTLKVWNVFGIVILVNTVFTGIFSAPTAFRIFNDGISTSVLGTFPFLLLPGFVVPFAFACHILSLKKLSAAPN